MNLTTDITFILGIIMTISFIVNIATELTKEFVPIPTKLWCILVATSIDMALLFASVSLKIMCFNAGYVILSLVGSFIIAFVAMYGFDTVRDLWIRFRNGEDINE